ncbi:hypothetical protein [Helicobacter sp. 11S02629-2]|uniref:hypothetical protein n=1 Tax=Helicobacter sp. 11S02629-2 TaxID=1476195 RepID=UPI000BA714D9|nr:hypothetical protein [Helicobacter sp. 11S02629-2]PAF42405.1 hypothetical protein BKH40_07810 [Helicobacter sp. 11S02629-2]
MEELQIKLTKAFLEISNLKEAKTLYKKLALSLHPDKGGSTEAFQTLNQIYNLYLENRLYFSSQTKINLELEKVISHLLHIQDITIEVVGKWIWISGNTKEHKDTLKDLGFKYASKKKMWYYGETKKRHAPQEMEEIRAKYGSIEVEKPNIKKLPLQA